jgi:PAB1-binding protein PBP1
MSMQSNVTSAVIENSEKATADTNNSAERSHNTDITINAGDLSTKGE